jgi:hypothetical protein
MAIESLYPKEELARIAKMLPAPQYEATVPGFQLLPAMLDPATVSAQRPEFDPRKHP